MHESSSPEERSWLSAIPKWALVAGGVAILGAGVFSASLLLGGQTIRDEERLRRTDVGGGPLAAPSAAAPSAASAAPAAPAAASAASAAPSTAARRRAEDAMGGYSETRIQSKNTSTLDLETAAGMQMPQLVHLLHQGNLDGASRVTVLVEIAGRHIEAAQGHAAGSREMRQAQAEGLQTMWEAADEAKKNGLPLMEMEASIHCGHLLYELEDFPRAAAMMQRGLDLLFLHEGMAGGFLEKAEEREQMLELMDTHLSVYYNAHLRLAASGGGAVALAQAASGVGRYMRSLARLPATRGHGLLAHGFFMQADLHSSLGESAAALAAARRLLALPAPPPQMRAMALLFSGRARLALGRAKPALLDFRALAEAAEVAERRKKPAPDDGGDPPEVLRAAAAVGELRALLRLGRKADAEALIAGERERRPKAMATAAATAAHFHDLAQEALLEDCPSLALAALAHAEAAAADDADGADGRRLLALARLTRGEALARQGRFVDGWHSAASAARAFEALSSSSSSSSSSTSLASRDQEAAREALRAAARLAAAAGRFGAARRCLRRAAAMGSAAAAAARAEALLDGGLIGWARQVMPSTVSTSMPALAARAALDDPKPAAAAVAAERLRALARRPQGSMAAAKAMLLAEAPNRAAFEAALVVHSLLRKREMGRRARPLMADDDGDGDLPVVDLEGEEGPIEDPEMETFADDGETDAEAWALLAQAWALLARARPPLSSSLIEEIDAEAEAARERRRWAALRGGRVETAARVGAAAAGGRRQLGEALIAAEGAWAAEDAAAEDAAARCRVAREALLDTDAPAARAAVRSVRGTRAKALRQWAVAEGAQLDDDGKDEKRTAAALEPLIDDLRPGELEEAIDDALGAPLRAKFPELAEAVASSDALASARTAALSAAAAAAAARRLGDDAAARDALAELRRQAHAAADATLTALALVTAVEVDADVADADAIAAAADAARRAGHAVLFERLQRARPDDDLGESPAPREDTPLKRSAPRTASPANASPLSLSFENSTVAITDCDDDDDDDDDENDDHDEI